MYVDILRKDEYSNFDDIIYDTVTNTVVALVKKNIIYVMFQYESMNSNILTNILDRYNNKYTYQELREKDLVIYDNIRKGSLKSYVNIFVKDANHLIKEKEDELSSLEDEYKITLEKLHKLATNIYRIKQELGAIDIDKLNEENEGRALNEIKMIEDLEKVSHVNIDEGNNLVHVYTHNMYVQDYNTGKWYDIGTFKITISLGNSSYDENYTIKVYNTKYLVEAFNNEMNAPHIFPDGHMCHGNLASGVSDSYMQRDLFGIVYQILVFLGSVNLTDAAGKYLTSSWPEVPEEEALSKDNGKRVYGIEDNVSDDEFAEALSVI
jgi:hypothetical protein